MTSSTHSKNSTDRFEAEKSSDYPDKPFRFIDRDELLGRSTGRFNIVRIGENSSYIYLEDWFHTIASLATHKVILLIIVLYFISVIFWAALFYLFRDCGFVDITTFVAAMIISLETITTVGYSVSDINFGDHPIAFFLLYGEMMQAILMNSFCIGIVYTRLSRAITRSRSLIFSDKAIIKRIDGQWCLVFQVCELRKHQLVEAHVSCYCVQKTVSEASGVPFQMTRMRLTRPPEAQNGRLVLMLPAFISHPIDAFSPLFPDLEPVERQTMSSSEDLSTIRKSRCFTSSHVEEGQAALPSLSDLQQVWPCSFCNEVYVSESTLNQHILKEHGNEILLDDEGGSGSFKQGVMKEGRRESASDRRDRSSISMSVKTTPELTGQVILDTIRRKDLEIIVLIEGTESVTSSKLQARYSYAIEDIVVNRMFCPCVTMGEDGKAVIDFVKFHQTVPVDPTDVAKEDLFVQSVFCFVCSMHMISMIIKNTYTLPPFVSTFLFNPLSRIIFRVLIRGCLCISSVYF